MAQQASIATETGRDEIAVWDLFVRVFHWTLVISFTIAFVTEDDLQTFHNWSGYIVGGLIIIRLLWGFVGPRTARFSSFVTSPGTAIRYGLALLSGRAKRYTGHSPAGGVMVMALLIVIAGAVATGIMLDQAGDDNWVEELHEGLANVAVVLIFFHVGGVVLASFAHRENLVRAMFTGRKRAS